MPGIRPLSPELEAIAREELNEVPERRDQDITHIKEWLEKQPHLNARTDDQFILTFLRGCKFSLERTKEKLDAYYTMRTAVPDIFSRRDPMLPELQKMLNAGIMMPLGIDNKGRRVWQWGLKDYDPSKSKVEDMFKLAFMMAEVMLLDSDSTVICGQVGLVDLEGSTVAHLAQLTPAIVKKIVTCWQEGYPIRPQALHFVNSPPIFMTMLNFLRSVLNYKLKKRILCGRWANHSSLQEFGCREEGEIKLFINPSMEELVKSGLKPILPEEYGGDAGPKTALAAAWKAKLESYRDYFLEDEQYRADESRRPGQPKTQEDLFGMTGSFRKLGVD